MPVSIFISYAPEDRAGSGELQKALVSLRRNKEATFFDQHDSPTDDRQKAIDSALATADVVLLLLSNNYFAFDECYEIQSAAYGLSTVGKVKVIPILYSSVDWSGAAVKPLQALPRNGKPITMWQNKDEAYTQIAVEVTRLVESLKSSGIGNGSGASRKKVFVSHSSLDKPAALQVKSFLESHHIEVIMDTEDFQGGQNLGDSILKSIKSADRTLFLISENSLRSTWVGMEFFTSFQFEKFDGKGRIIGGLLDKSLFDENFIARAIESFLQKVNDYDIQIEERRKLNPLIDISDLVAKKERYANMAMNLPKLVQRFSEWLSIDLSSNNWESGLKRLLEAIIGK